MIRIQLRTDLEPWTCAECRNDVYSGSTNRRVFYCDPCAVKLEPTLEEFEDETKEESEVNFVSETINEGESCE